VLALLLQHIGVTLSALSSVRDRLLGSLELFRVSPVAAGNILTGKSLGYALLLGFVALALTAAATFLLKVPSVGNPVYYWLSIALTIFASLGLGFALSVVANTESQAVQLSMLALLTSVFFGGFFLPLDQLFPWVRVISYVLPVTYGAIDLREVMLRGATPSWIFLLGPMALGLVFYVLATFGLQRQMRRA
jgi:ABC-2 type transport system permease protein